ncbi:hypothetical protein KK083_20040 [Fulvivirgaceae bacterium PWU4]|uniref:Uncharacterized protein n=1 Tax=Chryseosolibacter histidini TaxID=2782349 RepID=A0AAP2DMR8_9BACT|nr:hypothetical protein [Chryseosolibacter histidini]MBT1699198.1 hypothetical protein [Chryseosolibacter histidini]
MKLLKYLLIVQAAYIFLTALWPIVDIRSFMAVTGYKTDIWLVKTVGALLIPVALTLVMYLYIRTDRRPAFLLGSGTAAAFICIDFYYALTDVISDIYLADGFPEIVFLVCWLYIAIAHPHALKRI